LGGPQGLGPNQEVDLLDALCHVFGSENVFTVGFDEEGGQKWTPVKAKFTTKFDKEGK
jgi:hypothetical protein